MAASLVRGSSSSLHQLYNATLVLLSEENDLQSASFLLERATNDWVVWYS